jgi:malonate transporter
MIGAAAEGILLGYVSVTAVIVIGYVARRTGFLDAAAETVLNRVTVYIATPALYFALLARTDSSVMFSPYALATIVSVAVGLVLAALALLVRGQRRRTVAEIAMLMSMAVNPNSGNIGIPIAIAVLGTSTYLAPVIVLQVALLSPALMLLCTRRAQGRSRSRAVFAAFANPVVVSSMLGLAVSLLSVPVPAEVLVPVDLLGDASIPLMLLAFGASLRGARLFADLRGHVGDAWRTIALKVLVLPAVAFGIGSVLGISGTPLLALVIIAALPIAQSLYAVAHTFGVLPAMARSTIAVSTVVSLPAALAAAALLS